MVFQFPKQFPLLITRFWCNTGQGIRANVLSVTAVPVELIVICLLMALQAKVLFVPQKDVPALL